MGNPQENKYIIYTRHKFVDSWSTSFAYDDETLEDIKELFAGREMVVFQKVENVERVPLTQVRDWRVHNPAHIPFCDGSCDRGERVCPSTVKENSCTS